jgi:hypothetical protein
MTSLAAEAASFFPRCLFGCEKGQSGPEDVASDVLVGVRAVAAGPATERRLADAVLLRCVTTAATAVGSAPGIDGEHCASSFFRFGSQDRDEGSPARVGDAFVEPGLRCRFLRQEGSGGLNDLSVLPERSFVVWVMCLWLVPAVWSHGQGGRLQEGQAAT